MKENLNWPPPACPSPGIGPTTWACALTGNLGSWVDAQPLGHTSRAQYLLLRRMLKKSLMARPVWLSGWSVVPWTERSWFNSQSGQFSIPSCGAYKMFLTHINVSLSLSLPLSLKKSIKTH
uniref:Uncharacterized protein n=1 Tax=Molossus molossus TaxID=27622 RepID=A0A7J8EST4_MOLMO|nr:hypothetical protein HJG59_008773 [Molossus molossus]